MKRFLADIKRFGSYTFYSARAELKAEVAGSFLSWLWWILDPLLYMLIYSFIAIIVFGSGGSTEPYFPVFVFLGLNCWQFFSKTVRSCVKLVAQNRMIVTKVYIPKYFFILEKMGVFGFKMLISLALTVIFMIIYQVPISLNILMTVPLLLLLLLITFSVSTLLMHFGVFVEDLSNVITVVLQLAFYLSGVFYSIEARVGRYSELLADILLNCNPLALIMTDMRAAVMGTGEFHWLSLVIWFCIGILLSAIAVRTIYKRENSYVKRI